VAAFFRQHIGRLTNRQAVVDDLEPHMAA